MLGVMVTNRTVDAVLLDNNPSGPEILRVFRRHRHMTSQNASGVVAGVSGVAGVAEELDQDVMISFGESGGGGAELFLGSEFEALDTQSAADTGDGIGVVNTPAFELELLDILAECSDAGYENPDIAFCNGTTEVKTHELKVPVKKVTEEEKKVRNKKQASGTDRGGVRVDRPIGRNKLLELLREEVEDPKEDLERAAFIPMTATTEGQPRFLAILPYEQDPVMKTVELIRERKQRMPAVRLLDTEVSLYLGLARHATRLHRIKDEEADREPGPYFEESHRTLVVRASVEDTLVMFLEEETLQHVESLRSITTYDAPETICSRVLLLQDQYGTGDVQHVLILGEERENTLIESFDLFFPDARVESLRSFVPAPSEAEGMPSRRRILATTAALRLVLDKQYQGVFQDINLLPARLLKRKMRLPISWHVLVLYVVLFGTVLFFMARYFGMEQKTRAFREQMQAGDVEVLTADAKVLQARIDSMKAASAGYLRALDVLDSLLIGSDVWSRSLEKTSREARAVSGVWIESWRLDGNQLVLEGNATSRNRVVSLADRLDSSIESLSFSEIREWPVYSFRMKMPLHRSLPEAAKYLREHVKVEIPASVENPEPGATGS